MVKPSVAASQDMISRYLSSALLLSLPLLLLSCGEQVEDAPTLEEPALTMPALYRSYPPGCGLCSNHTLHRDGERIELRAHGVLEGEYRGLSTGLLTAEANEALTRILAELEDGSLVVGEPASNPPFDGYTVTLWVLDEQLSYPMGYPPEGLEELETLLWGALNELASCENSHRVLVEVGCEPLADDLW